jgi:hypothetical protein
LGNIKIRNIAPAAQTRRRFDSKYSLALKPQAMDACRAHSPLAKHHGASLIVYLFISWIASIATFLVDVFQRMARAIAFGIFTSSRRAVGRSSSATVRPAAEQCQRDRCGSLRTTSRSDTVFALFQAVAAIAKAASRQWIPVGRLSNLRASGT